MENYRHKIQYYETDKMGITHHSNYVRIMEETRLYVMDQLGMGYAKMEEEGVGSPVMGISLEYKKPTTYPDVVEVELKVEEISTFKVKFSYKMTVGGNLVCKATSQHCFIDSVSGRPVVIADRFPALNEALKSMMPE